MILSGAIQSCLTININSCNENVKFRAAQKVRNRESLAECHLVYEIDNKFYSD